jgi:hypothetical protein
MAVYMRSKLIDNADMNIIEANAGNPVVSVIRALMAMASHLGLLNTYLKEYEIQETPAMENPRPGNTYPAFYAGLSSTRRFATNE